MDNTIETIGRLRRCWAFLSGIKNREDQDRARAIQAIEDLKKMAADLVEDDMCDDYGYPAKGEVVECHKLLVDMELPLPKTLKFQMERHGLAKPCCKTGAQVVPGSGSGGCRAGRDGDCSWKGCPQIKDGEPAKTGRHCPLDQYTEEF